MPIVRPIGRPVVVTPEVPLRGDALPWDVQGGGSAPWTPAALASKLTLWTDERDLVVTGSGYSDWGNQITGGANDLSQGTDASRPASGQTINGYAAPDFDGSADFMGGAAISNFISASAYFARVIFRPDSLGPAPTVGYSEDLILGETAGYWYPFSLSTSGVQCGHWDGGNKQTGRVAASINTVYRARCQFSGGSLSLRVGSTNASSVAAGNVTVLTGTLRVGYRGADYYDGRVASIIVCNAALTAAEIASLDAYDAAKYGVTV
jgi:hypothetical protein